jgi:3'-phosphoadenosine 5'-phosphosulfate sulfotransferase (PAPS reductase)/FAD synthetase
MQSILNFSGGKDSTALLFGLLERGIIPDKIVFADTLLEFPEMYKFIAKCERKSGKKFDVLTPFRFWDDWFYGRWSRGSRKGQRRGFPMLVSPCYHARNAKATPLDAWRKDSFKPGTIVYVGLNADEKERMMGKPFVYPLIEWGMGTKEVIQYCKKIKMLNPLYKRFTRLGCWLCPYQSDRSLYSLWLYYPDLWARLKKYEKDSPTGFKIKRTLAEYENQFKKINPSDLEDASACSLTGDCRPLFGIKPKIKKVCGSKIRQNG